MIPSPRIGRHVHGHLARAALVSALGLVSTASWLADDDERIDFGREIRPILADKCFACHGPDEETREADLRLDLKAEALRDLGGYFVVKPGDSGDSELYLRVSDPDDPMPPAGSDKELSAEEIELLRRWIDQGAPWDEHWAYATVRRPSAPAVTNEDWARNAIDRFVRARLETEQLSPEPEAARASLLRRASLDLTGLPPTLAEIDAFVADTAAGAFERQVDRLLSSPRYGEHMARAWLDAARYGDTHGYHLDNLRVMWPYRDWVIAAYNANMPFDQFTIEQLAGDLLPDATLAQRVATGFNRCNPTSAEGGMIADEFMALYAADRVVTTSTVWLGTTMLCAQCHDHKFDPIAQEEFYGLFAFFNNISEEASDGNAPSPPPVVAVPSAEQRLQLAELEEEIAAGEAELEAPLPEIDAAQVVWEGAWTERLAERWQPVETVAFSSDTGASMRLLADGSLSVTGNGSARDVYEILFRTDLAAITALRLEALTDDELPERGPGRAPNGNFVLSNFEVMAVPEEPGAFVPVELQAAYASYSQSNYPVAGALDPSQENGWGTHLRNTDHEAWFLPVEPFGGPAGSLVRIRLRFESMHADHQLGRLRLQVSDDPTLRQVALGSWHALGPMQTQAVQAGELDREAAFDEDFGPEAGVDLQRTYADDELGWVEHPEWADGELHQLTGEYCATYLYRTLTSPDVRTLALSLGSDDAVKVWLNGELVLDERVARGAAADQNRIDLELLAGENQLLMKVVNYAGEYAFTTRRTDEAVGGLPVAITRLLGADERTEEVERGIREFYRRTNSPRWREMSEQVAALRDELAAVNEDVPLALVMEENDELRPAYVLERGRYDKQAGEVQPATPSFLPPLESAEGARATRLDFARWLVAPEHPLTARVAVNRLWQGLFGRGLVRTTEDLGSQGEWPSHPELLDWLAAELVASGWDVQHMLRLMVTSATYRQAAATATDKRTRDPENRLLARGPRLRLNAERIRDGALFVAGLLNEELGGPSVRPYQPAGVWQAVAYTSSNTAEFVPDEGDALYRRSLYTFWKRTAPPPSMQIFDAPTREACTVERARTNTPLQALVLLNDEQFVEAARAFAQRILTEGPDDVDGRLALAFRMATSRRANARELATLRGLLEIQLLEYGADADAARALLAVGASAPDAALDAAELAAWTHVTNLLLNLDEVVTKG